MKKRFILEGLGCANCASKMETAINKLNGVKEVSVNFMTQKLTVEADEDRMPSNAEIERSLRKLSLIQSCAKIVIS